MKIVVFPGVGFFNDNPPNRLLIQELKKIPKCELIWCNWMHWNDTNPDMKNLSYQDSRKWLCEVLLDFQTVVKHAFDVPVPVADFYVGHSAGSILALIQSKPSIVFGSPACLIEEIQGVSAVDCLLNSSTVLNIVHKKDILSYPFKFANNIFVDSKWWKFSSWNPLSAHTCYWDDPYTVNIIVSTLKEWQFETPE